MAANHGHALDDGAVLLRHHFEDFALLAFVLAGDDHDVVALLDLELRHHKTSGASETIFMWFLALSSRVTGPKMRVPIGSPCGLMSTAALRSKRISDPSGRRMPLAVRTTTAFITWPFLTRPFGIASLTETTMVSPMVAYLRFDPPSTLMHWTRRAPELSATSRLVSIWIIALFLSKPRPQADLHPSAGRARKFNRPQVASVSTTQRLFFEMGALSTISTRSPILKAFFSSCAWYFFVRRTVFLNSGWV